MEHVHCYVCLNRDARNGHLLSLLCVLHRTLIEGLPENEVLHLDLTFDSFAPLVELIYGAYP